MAAVGARRAKKTTGSNTCANAACPHVARLEATLLENKFLGETVENLQQALQMADQHCEKYREEIAHLSEIIENDEQKFNQLKQSLREYQLDQKELQERFEECRQLRADKTQLIQQSWTSLQQLAQIRQKNDQLEKQMKVLQDELDGYESVKIDLRSDKLQNEIENIENDACPPLSWDNNEIETIRQQIEILERQALASTRLQQDLAATKERCRHLQLRLDECTKRYDDANEMVSLYNEREAVLLEQLKREMLANTKYSK